jgi:crotonobetainyl-CoA:carnitine CoA-transferase CaiB-like acyl-CoA transferase
MGALDGLKILDFSALLPGPYATLYMADLGAEVLRVESSKPGLDTFAPPLVPGEGPATGISANNSYLARNKRSITLDLKQEEAVKIVYELVKEYDIVIDQFRPGVMDRMGIGYEQLAKVNPRVIFCSLTGYGQSGPIKMRAGHDINYLALSGLMSYSGRTETGPNLYGMQIADVCSGSLNTIIGVLAAVVYRDRTGEGQYVDVSMLDGAVSFNAIAAAAYLLESEQDKEAYPVPEGKMLNGASLYDFYETSDRRYISAGPVEPKFFANFCNVIGRPDLIPGYITPKDPQVKEDVRAIIKEKTQAEWIELFKDVDACVEPVLNLKEALLEDEQVRQRDMVVDVPVPGSDGRTIAQLGNPLKLSKCPPVYRHTGYRPGHHTQEVLRELGYADAAIERMTAAGLFG